MTEIKHTPWEFRKYPGMSIGSIVGNNGRIIAENVNENFAEVIIRACNAHDDLVAALKGLLNFPKHFFNDPSRADNMPAFKAAKAALAKAEAKS